MKLNKWLSILVVSCSLLIGFTACDDDDNDQDEGTIRVMAYGFCYDTSKNPTIYSATVKTLPENGKMEATLTELADNTVYYVRAFATLYPNGVVYSPEVEMTVGVTEPETPSEETPTE